MTTELSVRGHAHAGRTGRFLELDWQPEFSPGQHIGLSIPDGPPPRLYSVASVPGSPLLRVLYTLVPQGELTPRLWELNEDDRVLADSPGGSFFPLPRTSMWIAAGTGIAPFISMLSLLSAGFFPRQGTRPPVTLLQSSRDREDLWGQEEFANLEAQGLLEYRRFVTRPGAQAPATGIWPGRVLPWLQQLPSAELARYEHFMICGSTQMILDTRDCLLALGVAYDRIVSEVYF